MIRKILYCLILLAFSCFNTALKADNAAPTPTAVLDNTLPFTVYPNPLTTNKLIINIGFDQPTSEVKFSVSNVLGQEIFTYTLTAKDYTNGSFTVDFSSYNLDKGIYLMKMSKDGKSSVQKLVIK